MPTNISRMCVREIIRTQDEHIKFQDENSAKKDLNILTKAGQGLPSISIVAPREDEWEEIEITIGSGACETVLPSRMLTSIKLQPNEASRRGDEYEIANGHTIPVEGEKRCIMMTTGSLVPKGIVFQVPNVHKTLMYVSMGQWRMQDSTAYYRHLEAS